MKRLVQCLLVAPLLALLAVPAFAIDLPHGGGTSDCSLCHTIHSSPGGSLNIVDGNANLCQSCHYVGGPATAYPFTEADQALPGPGLPAGTSASGFSHRWDSGPAGHVIADGSNTSTGTVESGGAFNGSYPKTYTVTIVTGGDTGTATFDWSDTQGGSGAGVSTGVDVILDEGVSVTFTNDPNAPGASFVSGDFWNVFVRTDLNGPVDPEMAARFDNGKIICSTCHDVHSQENTPFDPDAPATPGDAGRHFQRVDNDVNQMCADCHSARDVTLSSNGSHPVGVVIPGAGDFQAPATLPLDASSQVACLTCHQIHYAPTSDGTLTRDADVAAMCQECHTLADPSASHMDAATGVLWPGGQYGTTFPEVTDTGKRGSCVNCHQPHGWPDTATPTQDYAKLLVEDASSGICFTCHDSDGPSGFDIHTAFNGTTNYQDAAGDGALINQRHDVSTVDQAYSGGVVACANCHNPHLVTSSAKIIDPDTPTTAYTNVYAKNNVYNRSGYNFSFQSATSDLDPMAPIGCTPQAASIGPAVPGPNAGDDTGTSGGDYSTGTEDQTYTATVSTGGAPPTAEITVTSTGSDSSGPTSVSAFGAPVSVGNFGVTITFTEPTTPGSVGAATCSTSCDDDTATSGGTYTGPTNGTYTLDVTTAGTDGNAVITCTSNIAGDACNPSDTFTWNNGVATPIGSYGVEVTITDPSGGAPSNRNLLVGEQWQIPVTAGGSAGDGVLLAGDYWTIDATAATAGCSTADEPDMVTFCLVCHDNSPPAGVTMSPSLVNIADTYSTADQHGRIAGNNGGNGFMKAPWQDIVANGDGTWANAELPNPYASLQCTFCHDGHGSDNLFHLRTSINIRGVQMNVGGGPGSGFESAPFTAASDHGFGDTTYVLPCFDGNTQVSCSNPAGVQVDHGWGAFCTFCHDMQTHGQSEDNDACRTGHRHGGGAF